MGERIMELNEAIETLNNRGFICEDKSKDVPGMIYNSKPTNLYRAVICCLEHNNNARSKDIMNDDVVTNWHNLVPLMSKKINGNPIFTNTTTKTSSSWSVTHFGYNLYKEAAEKLGETPMNYVRTPGELRRDKSDKLYKLLNDLYVDYSNGGPQEFMLDDLDEAKKLLQELLG